MSYVIGIDVGTSKIKAVLFDLEGNEKRIAYSENIPIVKGEKVEQDMNVLWNRTLKCLKEILTYTNPKNVQGIGVTGQGDGLWLIDKDGKPVSNAILWNDGRSKKYVEELKKNKYMFEKFYKITGTPAFSGSSLMLLKWLKDNEYQKFNNADTILFCHDWVRFKLTNKKNMEITGASSSLLNLENNQYAYELFNELDIEECEYLLPDLIHSSEIVGTVSNELSEITGLPSTTPVIGGAVDVMATAIGSNSISSGNSTVILGTTCATMNVTNHFSKNNKAMRFEKHPLDNLYVNVQPTMAGTPNIDWVLENIELTAKDKKIDYEKIDMNIKNLPPVPKGIIYHPYISISGERAPFYNPNARANFFGISIHSRRNDLIKSVYEGVAFSVKDCFAESSIEDSNEFFLAGGGSESEVWSQILADCTNKVVKTIEGNEIAAKGAAIMIYVSLGMYLNYKEALEKCSSILKKFVPIDNHAKIYDSFYILYKNLRSSLENSWNLRNFIINKEEA